MPKDIVREILSEVRRAAPAEMRDTLVEIEARVRQRWGGERVYVQKESVTVKMLGLARELALGAEPGEAFRRLHISRTTGYRLMRSTFIKR